MPDLPDWYQGFQLVGADITINVNIEASGVTLPISIDATTVTLDVNLTGQDVTINFNFADQSVAVFDAAKWFAHQAEQVFVTGDTLVNDNTAEVVIDYTVPANKVFFLVVVAYDCVTGANLPNSCSAHVVVGATRAICLGSRVGIGLPLDTPVRVTAGVHLYVQCGQYGAGADLTMWASVGGYLEDA